MTTYRIGVDTGGTFTDCIVVDDDGNVTAAKAASTPQDFSVGVMDSVARAAQRLGLSAEQLLAQTTRFGHGTTVATNALITHTGARTGILTTRGHEDALFMGRIKQKIAGLDEDQIHDFLLHDKAVPGIVPRKLIKGLNERVDHKGAVIVAMNDDEVRRLAGELVGAGCEAIAISLLWSFLNPSHERRARDIVREAYPNVTVSISCEISPVLGEYERTASTMVNAYLTKKVDGYIGALADRLRKAGFKHQLMVMLSNGGVTPAEDARRRAAYLLASGPAGGVIGARNLGQILGYQNVLTTDVGGTSFDVGLVVDGQPEYAREPVFDKYHVSFPMIDVVSIGSGGGSIAWIDKSGFLKVGPQSAGAEPGPACYGRGGTEPTVTDANVVLGRIDPNYFLGGTWKLDKTLAEKAIREKIAGPLGLSLEEAAIGIIDILDARMADLVRRVTIGRGLDPRNFALFAIGGAGALHVGAYAKDVGVKAVIVPMYASEFSALAIGTSEMLVVNKVSSPMVGPFDANAVRDLFLRLERDAIEQLRRAGAVTDGAGDLTLLRSVDMKYKGQVHDVSVPVPAGEYTAASAVAMADRFHERYEARYGKGTTNKNAPIEAMSFEVRVAAKGRALRLAKEKLAGGDATPTRGTRPVYFRETNGFHPTPIFDRETLQPGQQIAGPAVIEAPDTTMLVRPGQTVRMDEYRNLTLSV
ncbi:MAG TPA: hydantoinase/oxoprolinase family protein [Candidatus Limnocylindria bacterium]|nr:hydantoinase/oxoprolinase family protein [Candidatus Limnocylindria bacterium]